MNNPWKKFVFACVFGVIASALPMPAAATPPGECIPLVMLGKTDFDGDGKVETVLGATTMAPDAYRSVLVRSTTGGTLMDITDGSYYYLVQIVNIGAPHPILLTGTPFGNKRLRIQAWIYDPGRRSFELLKWDDSFYVIGLFKGVGKGGDALEIANYGLDRSYRYDQGQLKAIR